jgi:hypothetical protein
VSQKVWLIATRPMRPMTFRVRREGVGRPLEYGWRNLCLPAWRQRAILALRAARCVA